MADAAISRLVLAHLCILLVCANSQTWAMSFSARYSRVPVVDGVLLPLSLTSQRPSVVLHPSNSQDSRALYSLLLVDLDSSRPGYPTTDINPYVHWLVINIPGSVTSTEEIWQVGSELEPYVGPAPPTGIHRYVFYLIRQDRVSDDHPLADRYLTSLKDFRKRYGLNVALESTYFRARPGY
ncbi:hypothetical protein O6H91_12G012200 [Diphasiastrum complanatum]|uniref:Uncharacterized protein n=1 Tax=Diphasiastrum complanatum TaxID=34168 RepID=A0ACC2BYU9_DIPCM|nr:hypothetical protein O6H91_12G012200 [Diphasiastrum complanatum]